MPTTIEDINDRLRFLTNVLGPVHDRSVQTAAAMPYFPETRLVEILFSVNILSGDV